MRLFDTNILIDHLKGHQQALVEIGRSPHRAISVISWIEVLAGATPQTDSAVRQLLSSFVIVPISSAVAEQAVLVRRTRRLKLPDAMILATAQVEGCLLVTRNTRDFDPGDPGILVPYRI